MSRYPQKALALIVSGLFVCCLFLQSPAQPSLRFTPDAIAAYRQITRLEMDQASNTLRRMDRSDPQNRLIVFLRIEQAFLRCLITESPAAFEQFNQLIHPGIQSIQAVKVPSPWTSHCLGELYMMKGIIAYKQRDLLQAAREIRRGYRTIQEGLADYPKFLPSRRDMAILQLLIGTVPDRYQWAVELLSGIRGSTSQGQAVLSGISSNFRAQGHFLMEETVFLEAILLHYVLGRTSEAHALGKSLQERDPGHPVLLFLRSLLAQEDGHNDDTIRLLSTRQGDPRQMPFPYLTYLEGKAYLYRLDLDKAQSLMSDWLDGWQGTSLRADACQKLAWCALLDGYEGDFRRWMNRCAQEGPVYLEQDKQAQADARDGHIPHTGLLRARLLFDGGYFEEARGVLDRMDPATLLRDEDRLESTYRRGRVAQAMNHSTEAIRWLGITWNSGRDAKWHFACASALQLGHIYQACGNLSEAETWYHRCLSVQPDRYGDGLHQKAKAGLHQLAE